MGKIERGIKRICQECGALYYDLEKNPIVCPKCGAEFDPEAILKSRRTRPLVPENEEKQKAEDEETDNSEDLDEVETTIDDDDEDGVVGGILPAVEVEGEDGVSVGSNDEDILDNEAVLDDGDDLDDEQDMLKLDD